jgi:hypothetical protein
MSSHPDLRLDWCSHAAAKYACERWHYSRSTPAGKTVRVGVWEEGEFAGVVLFARGANPHIGSDFGLAQTQCVELVRVALTHHAAPVSRIVAIACRMVAKANSGLRLIISFADPNEGHVGTIYQAAGWLYSGHGSEDKRVRPYRTRGGQIQHWRTVAGWLSKHGRPSTVDAAREAGFVPLEHTPKYRYLMPLDDAMRAQIEPLRKPYPKRAKQASASDQDVCGGAAPTCTLQTSKATLAP